MTVSTLKKRRTRWTDLGQHSFLFSIDNAARQVVILSVQVGMSPPPFKSSKRRIDRTSPLPFYRQLVDIVLNGKRSPGDRLASEHQLCQTYGVSRSVVRQALAELANEGLIHKVKGQGVFFTGTKIDSGFVQQAAGFCEEMIAKGHQVKTRVLKVQIVPASVQVARQLGMRVKEEVVCLDRLRFLDGETLQVVCTFLPTRLCPGLELIDMNDRSLYQVLREKYALGPAGGERTVEAVPTPTREAALLKVPRGSPALLIKTTTRTRGGETFEYSVGIYRGDRTKLDIRLV
jgi:GntR family transcriptional regulator